MARLKNVATELDRQNRSVTLTLDESHMTQICDLNLYQYQYSDLHTSARMEEAAAVAMDYINSEHLSQQRYEGGVQY